MEERIKSVEEARRLKTTRTTAFVLGFFLITSLFSFVYAFIQQAEAKKQERLAVANAQMVQEIERRFRMEIKHLQLTLDSCRNPFHKN